MELTHRDRTLRNHLIRKLGGRLGERSKFEVQHAARVSVYAVSTGFELGLEGEQLLGLRYASELHDLGKTSFPDRLFERVPATEFDWTCIRLHPQVGVEMLSEIEWMIPSLEAILSHHERFDGSGYPQGLAGKNIPIGARIIAVAETFDAMTMPSGWRDPVAEDEALQSLAKLSGTQLDPEVVQAFLKVQPIIQPVGL